jgi:hypothetical protein
MSNCAAGGSPRSAHSPIQKRVKKPLNSSVCDLALCLSRLDTLGVKLSTALSWDVEPERNGLTLTVPAGVGMTFSLELERVVVISTVGLASGGGEGVSMGREEELEEESAAAASASALARSSTELSLPSSSSIMKNEMKGRSMSGHSVGDTPPHIPEGPKLM